MSNIAQIRPTRRVAVTAHRVTFELVPKEIVEKLFHAAIAVGWADGDGEYTSDSQDALDHLEHLMKVVGEASQYTVPVEREVEEPIQGAQR